MNLQPRFNTLSYLLAPFLLALLGCAAACGSASAQSQPNYSQSSQTSTSSTTARNEAVPAQSDYNQTGYRGYVGVYLGDLSVERARILGLKENFGAVVGKVEEGSPAANAGLRENDVILAFNAERVQNRAHFYHLLLNAQSGIGISLGISRGGVEQRLELVLGQRRLKVTDPCQRLFSEANAHLASATESRKLAEEALQKGDEKEARRFTDEEKMFRQLAEESRAYIEGEIHDGKIPECQPSRRFESNHHQIGLSLSSLTEQLAEFFNAPREAALITEVKNGELGDQAGLKAGDCIVTIDGKFVKSLPDIERLLDQETSGEIEIVTVRDRIQRTVKITLDKKED